MLCIREFEFVPSEDGYLALPFDLEGATEGTTLKDAVTMAADWLHLTAPDALLHGRRFPETASFDNAPREGGRVIAVAVPVELSDAPAMTAAEAARELGVSTARVAQMCAASQLASWRVGGARMVACESVEERKASPKPAGRPHAQPAMA